MISGFGTEALAARITAELARFGRVKPVGNSNVMIKCPFHDDESPSFCMSTVTGLYICYGCDVQGNFRKFLQQVGYSNQDINHHFGVTLEHLKKNAPPPPDPRHPSVVMESNRHIDEDLLGLFHFCPQDLLDEGFTEETLHHFRIGMDKVHERITFPLRDLAGNLVGISGRATRDDQAERYKVYTKEYQHWDLPPYNTDKASLLWNAHSIYETNRMAHGWPVLYVVEGFKAAMWLWQAGFTNVVALMTKRMSKDQGWIIQNMGCTVVLMLDNDAAGVGGTIKVSKDFAKRFGNFQIVEYSGLQPTDVPQDELPDVLRGAKSYSYFTLG